MKIFLLLLTLWGGAFAAPLKRPELPEDLGPASIDVSDYPTQFRQTYKKVFLPVYKFMRGGPARAINSPFIEIDLKGESILKREHPELFSDTRLAQVGPDVWRKEVVRLKSRPPCCGACPLLSTADARALWRFLVYDSLRRKTGAKAQAWIALRCELIKAFDKTSESKDNLPKEGQNQGEIRP